MKSTQFDRPILIGGAPSSGTTLLSVMLDAHPDIFCGPELSIFSHPLIFGDSFSSFKERFKGYYEDRSFSNEDAVLRLKEGVCPYSLIYEDNLTFYGFHLASFLQLISSSESFEDFSAKFYEAVLLQHGKKIWAEKTPSNLYAFGDFLDFYPEGRVIYLVRDPLDQIFSMLRRGFDFRRAVSIWLIETAICQCYHNHPRVYRIRYEDLVCNTRETIKTLLSFLGIDTALEEVLHYYRNSSRIRSDKTLGVMETWNNSPLQPPSKASVGIGERAFSPEQITAIFSATITNPLPRYENLLGQSVANLAEKLGYNVEPREVPDAETLLTFLAREELLFPEDGQTNDQIFQERFVAFDPEQLFLKDTVQKQMYRLTCSVANDINQKKKSEIIRHRGNQEQLKLTILKVERQLHEMESHYTELQAQYNSLLEVTAGLESARSAAEARLHEMEGHYSELQSKFNKQIQKTESQ